MTMSSSRHLALAALTGLAAMIAGAAGAETPPGALYGAKPGTPDISGVWYHLGKRDTPWTPDPKFTPTYEAERQRRVAAETAGKPMADLGSRCMPTGMPTALMLSGYPTEIIQTPGRVTVIKENLSQTLRIWTDGREQDKDPDPTFLGHSVGHWEGDTLVVDTVGLRDESLLDVARTMPHSTSLHLVMRFHKIDPKTLELKITADDPVAFAGKIETTSIFEQRNNYEVMEQYCEAPGFAVDADGALSTLPVASMK